MKNYFILFFLLGFPWVSKGQIVKLNPGVVTHVDTLCWGITQNSVTLYPNDQPQPKDSLRQSVCLLGGRRFQPKPLNLYKNLKHLNLHTRKLRLSELASFRDSLQYLEVFNTQIIDDCSFSFPNLLCYATLACDQQSVRVPAFLLRCPRLIRLKIEVQYLDSLAYLPTTLQQLRVHVTQTKHQIDTLPELLFQHPNLKYLEISCTNNKKPPLLKITQPNFLIEALELDELDLRSLQNLRALKNLPRLKILHLRTLQKEVDLTPFKHLEQIYIRDLDADIFNALKSKYPNLQYHRILFR